MALNEGAGPLTDIAHIDGLADALLAKTDSAYLSDVLTRRQQVTYRWSASADRTAQLGMRNGDEGYQVSTNESYRYMGGVWKLWHKNEVDFTPSFAGGVTIGNGVLEGEWSVHAGLATMHMKFTLGSTSVVGGDLRVNLPAPSPSTRYIFGGGRLSDQSAGPLYVLGQVLISGSIAILRGVRASGTYADTLPTTGSIPFVWATGDSFEFTVTWST